MEKDEKMAHSWMFWKLPWTYLEAILESIPNPESPNDVVTVSIFLWREAAIGSVL